jgi:hypothetical protein
VHYHETFWVVAGTAAPVIALALAVVSSDFARNMPRKSAPPWYRQYHRRSALLTVADFFLMTALLGVSLTSLAWSRDVIPPDYVAWLACLGLLTVGSLSIDAGRTYRPPRRGDTPD